MKFLDKILKISYTMIIIGGISNILVMLCNNGSMPVYLESLQSLSSAWFAFNDINDVNLWYLSDIFLFQNVVYSIGDLIIYCAFILMAVEFLLVIFYAIKGNFH